ncbi:hypothetical protein Ahy_A05g025208 [Arachis hypogaea]|uniref:Aminotransferase-like plant mobile domain-containing protein n=1 Tax=Arachis hypogaea TaxID=3818 RepID=A0A445D7W3_ARAHY|nr:hypothetical protein Ahy_A05g025208 [Arachis hypogaea]
MRRACTLLTPRRSEVELASRSSNVPAPRGRAATAAMQQQACPLHTLYKESSPPTATQKELPNRNLLVRKLDPPQSWNLRVENYLRVTGFYHVSRIGMIRGFHPLLAALVERWRPETHTFVLPVGDVTVTLEDVTHIFGLPIDGEPVSGWTDSSSDFVKSQSMAIFGRQPMLNRNSKSYIKLGWVRSIRDEEPLDTEESIRRYEYLRKYTCSRWSHSERSTAWLEKTVVTFRHDIDYMQEFEWRPYEGMIIPGELHGHPVSLGSHSPPSPRPPTNTKGHSTDQHCMALRGVQLYDWIVLHGEWIVEWDNRRHTRLRDLHPLPTWDFIPTPEYRDWYMRSYGHMLRLSEYVPQLAAPQPPAPQVLPTPQSPPAPQDPPQHAVF